MAGLLFVLGECGDSVSEAEFNDWYDNEHGPARLTVPGFINAVRYRASDSTTPSWLAIYDITSPSVVSTGPHYKALAAQASDRERALVPRCAMLNRRLYESYSVKVNPQIPPSVFPGKFILVVTMLVKPELEDEFNRWYEEEHMPSMAKVPGWYRGRRYKLVNSVELARGTADGPTHNYLAIHEWSHDVTYVDSPEFQAALETPSSAEVLKEITEIKKRHFVIHKDIQKPA